MDAGEITVDALEALVVGNADFESVERLQDVFCPFEAIGMVRQEIRHAHYLAHCLDPQRPHGFGAECLRALMKSAAAAKRATEHGSTEGSISPLSVHLMNLDKAQVRREWRNIDLLVVIDDEKLVVAIELKVDAGEHSGQLGRYRTVVSEQWPSGHGWRHLFLFLTKEGDETSDDGFDWLPVTLDALARELDDVVRKQLGSLEARALLAAYLSMLRRHHLIDEHLEELAGRLWSQHKEALEFLMDRRPDAGEGLSGMLFDGRAEIAERMSRACDLTIVPDDGSARLMRFAVRDWDSLPDFQTASGWTSSNRLVLIEIQRSSDRRALRMRFVLGPGQSRVRQSYYDALQVAGVPTSNRREITGRFTRLAAESLARDMDDSGDANEVFEQVVQKIEDYVGRLAPKYNAAFQALGHGQPATP